MSIEDHPKAVNQREEFSHWEIDMLIGRKEFFAVLLTLDEYTTKFHLIIKIFQFECADRRVGLSAVVCSHGECLGSAFHFITSDNGSELIHLAKLCLDVPIYYNPPDTIRRVKVWINPFLCK